MTDRSESDRRYYEANKERISEYKRQWAEANKDRRRESQRQWQSANADRLRQKRHEYYEANRDKIIASSRRRYEEKREAVLEQQASYYVRTKDKQRGKRRDYYERNRDAILARAQFERHGLDPEGWAQLWERQSGCCYLCGDELLAEKTHVDHDHRCCGKRKSCAKCRRGLACSSCNSAIGYMFDDPSRMRRVADALEIALAAYEKRAINSGGQLMFTESG